MNQPQRARLQTRDGQAVTFLGVKLSGELRGLLFEARIQQTFCNPADRHIEVVYTFPVPWGAVMLGVDVLLGDRHLSGAVVEKSQAERRYEAALAEGEAAIMLEENRDHSYTVNLGNLAPGERCVVTLRYAQTLQFEQRGLRLLVPTVIAPRYGDPVHDGGLLPHQAPSHSLLAEHPFEMELRLHGDLAKSRVASPSHPVGVAYAAAGSGGVLTVSLARRESLDRDFVLVIDKLVHDGVAVVARDNVAPGGFAVLASFCPRIPDPEPRAVAVKILVDCSTSMAGDSIDAARRALQSIVQQFGADDRFSLSRFGANVEHRSRGLWRTTDIIRLAAQRWVGALKANLGGTEIEAALSSTFALGPSDGCDVLIVTDGEVSEIEHTVETAKASGHRVFVVGIGSSPAVALLHRLAEATGGACDFVAPGEAVMPAILRTFARLRSPPLTELSVQWPEGVLPQWVSPLLPAVFDADTVNVFATLRQRPEGEVRLLGRRAGDAMAREIGRATLAPALETEDTVPRMAAWARIRSTSNETTAGDGPDATALAVSYGLVTSKTNFLLVHERGDGDKADDMPDLYKVEQMLAAGWGGVGSVQPGHQMYCDLRNPDYHGTPALGSINSPAIWRTASHSAFRRHVYEQDGIPSFLRRREKIINHDDPRYWIESEHCWGLTPLGVSEWLRITPASEWPSNYLGLRQIGLGAWLIDWLELSIAKRQEIVYSELQVVAAFLYLMSRRETHEALAGAMGLLGAFKRTLQRLRGMFASGQVAEPPRVEMPLVEAMVSGLSGMTATAWPDRVFALSDVAENVCDARELAATA